MTKVKKNAQHYTHFLHYRFKLQMRKILNTTPLFVRHICTTLVNNKYDFKNSTDVSGKVENIVDLSLVEHLNGWKVELLSKVDLIFTDIEYIL